MSHEIPSIAVVVPATKSYLYAIREQAVRMQSNLASFNGDKHIILVTDKSKEGKDAKEFYSKTIPELKSFTHIAMDIPEYVHDRKEEASLLMARMQQAGFIHARSLGVDLCLSLEADILPPPHALKTCIDTLNWADGYYQIAAGTYSNTAFLGGRGTYQHPIAEDFIPEEREVPEDVMKSLTAAREAMKEPNEEKGKALSEIEKKIKEYPPKGNVFALNAKSWRKRGWLDSAYPAIGRGSILPSDWCGLGFTLMGRKALDLATFDGFDGRGTQDLYLCWHRWNPEGLKIAIIPHVLCDHVKRVKKDDKEVFEVWHAYHEPQGECEGHLRMQRREWHPMS